jgi:hypothetical protein
MPAFIKTPADEHKWNAIKHSVAKQRGKKVEDFTDRDWATVNAAWHKSEGNMVEFQKIMKSISIPNPARVGIPSVKTPKTKKLPSPGAKPSVFFKSEPEEFSEVKHPTLCKLRDFLGKRHRQT